MEKNMFIKQLCPYGVVCPCPGDIYMYVTIIFKHIKPLHQSKPNFMLSIVRKCINGQGHMT